VNVARFAFIIYFNSPFTALSNAVKQAAFDIYMIEQFAGFNRKSA